MGQRAIGKRRGFVGERSVFAARHLVDQRSRCERAGLLVRVYKDIIANPCGVLALLECAERYGIRHLLAIHRPDSQGDEKSHDRYHHLRSFEEITL